MIAEFAPSIKESKKIENVANFLWKKRKFVIYCTYKIHQTLYTKGTGGYKDGGIVMKSYICELCAYEYDPAVGDPDNGIEPGTAFEDLPDDWVCPVCGAGKDEFVEA